MSTEISTPKNRKQFNLVSAVLAFLMWGGWAYNINHQPDTYTGVISGLTQGTVSFIITLFMVHAVKWLFQHISNQYLKLILPAMVTVVFTGSCLVAIHSFVGTPAILHTISPALSVAFIFCVFTAFRLRNVTITEEK